MNNQTTNPMSLQDFGKLIQSKHPEYRDLAPDNLGAKVLAKYPQYHDMVNTGSDPQPTNPSFLQEEGQNLKDAWKVAGAPQDLASPFEGSGHIADALVNTPVKHAIGAINSLATKIPAVKNVEEDFGRGIQRLGQTPIGQAVGGTVKGFEEKHPRLTAAAKGLGSNVNAGLTVATIGQGGKALLSKLKGAPTTGLAKTLVDSGVSNEVEAPTIGKVLANNGLTDINDARNVAVTANRLKQASDSLKDIVSMQAVDPVSGAYSATDIAAQTQLSWVEKAREALNSASQVGQATPGLLSRLASGGVKSVGHVLGYPLKHPGFTAATGYGVYRKLGGEPLFGTF